MTQPRFPSISFAGNSCLRRGGTMPLTRVGGRILILSNLEDERNLLRTVVREQGLNAIVCKRLEELCGEIDGAACAAILGAEFLDGAHSDCLAKTLSGQPSWSDFPLIVLAEGKAREAAWEHLGGLEEAGNVKVMERPVRVASLLNAVQVALRSRCRQYEMRDQLVEAGRHQQAAEAAEERLRLTFESAKDYAILSLDLDGRITSWNAGAEAVFGYSGQEVLGREVAFLFTPEDQADGVPQREMERAASTGSCGGDRWHLRRNGSRFFASGMTRPVWGTTGNLLGFTKVARDVTWRRQAQENLMRERNFSEVAINSLPGVFYLLDVEGRFLRWNENLERVSGYSSEEISKMHPLDFIADHHRPMVAQAISEVFAAGAATVEAELLGKNGSRIPYFFNGKRFQVEERPCLIGMGMDITERKQAEQAQADLAAIVESSGDAIVGRNLEETITSWNAAAERIFGYRAEEAVGQPVSLLLPRERLAEESAITARLLRGEWVKPFETIRMAKGGREVEVSLTVSPIRDASGKIVGASKIARDITERKAAEAALRKSSERLDMVTQLTEIGLWYCDLPFGKLVWNPKCKEHFGLPPDTDVTIQLFYDQIHPEERGRTRQAIEDSIGEHKGYDTDFRTMSLDGRMRWIRAIGRAFYDAAGKPTRFDGITVDVTSHKEIEQKLEGAKAQISRHAAELEERVQERTAELQESIQALEGVLYHVAHDLRAPLRAMQGFTSILLNDHSPKLDEKGEDYAQRISMAASRMDRLIQDLLAYGRLAHTPLSLSRVSLAWEIEVVRNRLAEEIKASSADLQVDESLPEVQADPAVLDEILAQLLRNALTFVPRGVIPRIRICAERAGLAFIRIWVEDNGVGIEPEYHERIFGVFERLQSGDVYIGTGIGLALVRKGVERMGGRAGVESKLGKGSRFWLELPAVAKE